MALTTTETLQGLAKIQQGSSINIDKSLTEVKRLISIKDRNPQENSKLALELEKIALYEDTEGYIVSKTTHEKYKLLGVNLLKKLKEDYQPNSHYQLQLINMTVTAYLRYMSCSEKYNDFLELKSVDRTIIRYYEQIGKEIESSLRQYNALIVKLNYISEKKINFKVQINSINAYIGVKNNSNAKCLI